MILCRASEPTSFQNRFGQSFFSLLEIFLRFLDLCFAIHCSWISKPSSWTSTTETINSFSQSILQLQLPHVQAGPVDLHVHLNWTFDPSPKVFFTQLLPPRTLYYSKNAHANVPVHQLQYQSTSNSEQHYEFMLLQNALGIDCSQMPQRSWLILTTIQSSHSS